MTYDVFKDGAPGVVATEVRKLAWLDQCDLRVVDTPEKIDWMLAELASAPFITFDVETTGLNVIDDHLVAIQFCGRPDVAYFIPIAMHGMTNVSIAEVIVKCRHLWTRGLVGHNINFDWQIMRRWVDFEIQADTMLGVKCNPESWLKLNEFKLKILGNKYLNRDTLEFKELFPPRTKKTAMRFDYVPQEHAVPYACQDVILTFLLYEWVKRTVDTSSQVYQIEHGCIKPLAEMELLGVRLDTNQLRVASHEAEVQLAGLRQRVNEIAGYEVNVDSTKQLRKLLFEDLQLPVIELTGQNDPSTAVKALEALKGTHEIIEILSDYRNVSKLQVAFLEKLPKSVASDGCIHTSYNQWGAISGRTSSAKPNLQQIPKERNKHGDAFRLAIRSSFLPPTGYVGFLDIDFSQIEYRLFASLSGDDNLIQAFLNGEDVHKRTAAMMFKVPYDHVDKTMRDKGKTSNFAAIYGQGEKALAETWKITVEEAREIMAGYWGAMPKAKAYVQHLKRLARARGYCETFFGRKRLLPNILAKQFGLKSMSEREAVNTPVQGMAGDLMKLAIIRSALALKSGFKSRMVLTVHDQLVTAHHPDDNLDQLAEAMREAMEIDLPGFVPLISEAKYGPNWNDVDDFIYPSRRPGAAGAGSVGSVGIRGASGHELCAAPDGGGSVDLLDVVAGRDEDGAVVPSDQVVPGIQECGEVERPKPVGGDAAAVEPDVQPAEQDGSSGGPPEEQRAAGVPGVRCPEGGDYLQLTFPESLTRDLVMTAKSILAARRGTVPVYVVVNGKLSSTEFKVKIATDLLMRFKSLGISFELGVVTKSVYRAAYGAT